MNNEQSIKHIASQLFKDIDEEDKQAIIDLLMFSSPNDGPTNDS